MNILPRLAPVVLRVETLKSGLHETVSGRARPVSGSIAAGCVGAVAVARGAGSEPVGPVSGSAVHGHVVITGTIVYCTNALATENKINLLINIILKKFLNVISLTTN